MKAKAYILAGSLLAMFVLGAGCNTPANNNQTQNQPTDQSKIPASMQTNTVVGGDRDAHGCIGSAGYSWCEVKQKCLRVWEEACTSTADNAPTTTVTYLVSNEDTNKYCNGDNMDSAGFRKTITQEKTGVVSKQNIIKDVAILSTSGQCQQALREQTFTLTNGTVSISPIDGWAGVSIAMCYCKPQVEVNLLRLPDVKNVVWQ